jgi:hypothetical protein
MSPRDRFDRERRSDDKSAILHFSLDAETGMLDAFLKVLRPAGSAFRYRRILGMFARRVKEKTDCPLGIQNAGFREMIRIGYRDFFPSTALAGRAIIGRTLALPQGSDRRAACPAAFPVASIYKIRLLEITRPTLGTHVVPKAAAARLDRG